MENNGANVDAALAVKKKEIRVMPVIIFMLEIRDIVFLLRRIRASGRRFHIYTERKFLTDSEISEFLLKKSIMR